MTSGTAGAELERLAHAVLLPAVAGLDVAELLPLLERGCRAVLLGETRAEYVARKMSPERVAAETAEGVVRVTAALRAHAGDRLVVAVDHEVVGIRRFAHLLPPDRGADPGGVRDSAREAGRGLRELGVNVVLGPIVDVVRGANPWLSGRNLGPDPAVVAAGGVAAVRGLREGGVVAVAKHYPGHAVVPVDPAVAEAEVPTPAAELDGPDEEPFAAVVAAGVRGLMLGPALVPALDPGEAASCSAAVVRRARERLGFRGTLVSDDLDAPGILRGRSAGEAAVASLAAGADLLLVAAPHAPACAAALVASVRDGRLTEERLAEAARGTVHLLP